VVRVRGVHDLIGGSAKWTLIALALFWGACAQAETQVYLLRGWFGVFSTGLDTMAEELRAKGIKAEAVGHLAWRSTASKVVRDREAGKTVRLVLIGHSQGGNNVIDIARDLEGRKIPVDLLITLAPWLQDPVPSNVVRALNYYQSGGWGSPLTAVPGFKGELSNIDLASDQSTFHANIDKNAKIQAEIVRAIAALNAAGSARPVRADPQAGPPATPAPASPPAVPAEAGVPVSR
jgi:hypothetical protein